jgi:hypothetical protein
VPQAAIARARGHRRAASELPEAALGLSYRDHRATALDDEQSTRARGGLALCANHATRDFARSPKPWSLPARIGTRVAEIRRRPFAGRSCASGCPGAAVTRSPACTLAPAAQKRHEPVRPFRCGRGPRRCQVRIDAQASSAPSAAPRTLVHRARTPARRGDRRRATSFAGGDAVALAAGLECCFTSKRQGRYAIRAYRVAWVGTAIEVVGGVLLSGESGSPALADSAHRAGTPPITCRRRRRTYACRRVARSATPDRR